MDFLRILRNMPSFDIIEFGADDICRSGLVKEYIISKLELGIRTLMFNHVNIDLPSLNKETIDGVRYYDVPGNAKLVSITSITSWINREIFREWRARVGNEQADKVTKAATSRGYRYAYSY